MKRLIAFCGYAESGKDSCAQAFIDQGFQKIAFADPLRQAIYNLNPIIWQDNSSFTPMETRVQDIVNEMGWDRAKKEYQEIRRLLQYGGTEAGRHIHGDNCWVDAAERTASRYENVVMTDCRFFNESAWVKQREGFLIRIIRPEHTGNAGTVHASERDIPNLPADIEIINEEGKLDETIQKVLKAVEFFEAEKQREAQIIPF